MAQHDQVIDDGPGLAVRTDINAALAALFSSSAGVTAPTVRAPGQLWFDTSNTTAPTLWIRKSDNTAWMRLATISPADIGFGQKLTPDRFVWNDKADMTGRDIMVLQENGDLEIGATLTLRETDNSIRAKIQAGIGSDPGTTTYTVHDAAGAVVGTMKQSATGLDLFSNGVLRFYDTGGINRGAISANTGDATARITINARDGAGAVVNTANIDADGIRMSSGDFYVLSGTVRRARFGWDSGNNGAFIQARDAADALLNTVYVTTSGIWLQGPNATAQNFYGRNSSANVTRFVYGGNTDGPTSALGFFSCWDNAESRKQRVEFDAAGMRLLDGASAGNVMTDGNFPSKSSNAGNTDFPIGSFILFTCPAGNEVNRSQDLTLRLNTLDNFSYRHTGSGTLLAGRWINTGISTGAALGLGRRIS